MGVLKNKELFDAIICDPPYGWRASARESGASNRSKNRIERLGDKFDNFKKNDPYLISYKATKVSGMDKMVEGLFEISLRILKVGGKLCYLYPVDKRK